METVTRRSESPFTRSRVKDHENGTENGKGKVIKNKQKSQQQGLESEDSRASEKDDVEKGGNEADNDSKDSENKITNGNNIGIENGHQEGEEVTNNNSLINDCESQEDVANGDYNETDENGATEEIEVATGKVEISELAQGGKPIIIETEIRAKIDTPQDDSSQNSETLMGEAEKVSNGETDNFTQEEEEEEEEVSEVGSTVKNISEQTNSNGSENGSHYEDAHSTKDDIQLSLDGTSLSGKLSSFWGKWNSSSQEEKKDSEMSSSKNVEGATVNHPYLSKVSGRRGIKDKKLNSSATVFGLKDEGRRTPENSEINLDDSFRVRTNPPRLNSSGILENPTLKKYKGKRCLNASDEPEEEDEVGILSSTKRRKLDRSEESGLLGGLLWSPFKKKPSENELKLSAAESKLSKFLSPFWFWKKLAASQK